MLLKPRTALASTAFYGHSDDNATKIKGSTSCSSVHFRADQMNLLPQKQQGAGSDSWNSNSTSLYTRHDAQTSSAASLTRGPVCEFLTWARNYNNQLNRGLFYAGRKNTPRTCRTTGACHPD